jgi:hypothetical protein
MTTARELFEEFARPARDRTIADGGRYKYEGVPCNGGLSCRGCYLRLAEGSGGASCISYHHHALLGTRYCPNPCTGAAR